MVLFVPSGRSSRTWLTASLALVAQGCVFHPPPPLPEELAAQKAAEEEQRAAARAAESPEGTTVVSGGEKREGEELSFTKGQEPPVGMSPEEIRQFNQAQGDPVMEMDLASALEGVDGEGTLMAEIVTKRGVIDCELFEERTPYTVANFVGLARGLRPVLNKDDDTWAARKYYDGGNFHRSVPGFMIQGGDPTGTGRGNPGYVIRDEIRPDLRHDGPGKLSMANKGVGTASAQFFVTLGPAPHLDGSFTIFGECSEKGIAVADEISAAPRDANDLLDEPEPIETIRIFRR